MLKEYNFTLQEYLLKINIFYCYIIFIFNYLLWTGLIYKSFKIELDYQSLKWFFNISILLQNGKLFFH